MQKDELFDYYQEVARSGFADMLHDTERNRKYSMAIKEAIQVMKARGKKANVLDIGTGTGLLAMLSAQHGADSVVTIEAFSPVSHIARKIISKNGFKRQIKIINKHSTEITIGRGGDIEQKANILVAEVFDTELIGEGAVTTYNHAHEHLMEEDCICVPDSALVFIQVVDCEAVVEWNTLKLDIKYPQDITECSGSHAIHDVQLSQLPQEKITLMSEPTQICKFDFSGHSVIPPNEEFKNEIIATTDGRPTAVFFWWDLNMNPSGSILLSCGPHWTHPDTDVLANSKEEVARQTAIPWRDHWMQGIFYLKGCGSFNKGSVMHINACHDEFSWWFDVQRAHVKSVSLERPTCTCLFHICNSRNRIMQINSLPEERSSLHISGEALCVGDFNMKLLKTAELSNPPRIYILQQNSLCFKSLKSILQCNELESTIQLIASFEEIPKGISTIIAEPYFNNSVLPWDNITEFWSLLRKLEKLLNKKFITSPVAASIHAVPVNYLHLHKIRWPLKSTCEGFDHRLFDKVIELASSIADENVEPFSLWEYPCKALGSATKIFDIAFNDESIRNSEASIDLDIKGNCNGVALWVEWQISEENFLSCGPQRDLVIGELIKWKISQRQGVHLIPSSAIEAGQINAIDIKTHFDENAGHLQMCFKYSYQGH